MPNWNSITTDDVLSEFNNTEQEQLQELQADTQRLASILDRAIASARGQVQAGGGQVDQDGTIANSLIPLVIAIVRWRWLTSIPKSDALQSDARKELHTQAVDYLKEVAKGEIKVEVPDAPVAATNPTNAVAVARPGRHVKTDTFDKLGAT